jgi:predicted esterase
MIGSPRLLVRSITATARGRYLLDIPAGEGPAPLLVGFHGYGENAETHLEQLRQIPEASRCRVVSIQALHRFYNTKTGAVVGSWMTKLEREEAIHDNVQYVVSVLEAVRGEPGVGGGLVYVGYSQGAAMACRAAARSGHRGHGLLLLGGDLPPDVAEDPSVILPPILLARGRRDEWYTQAKMEKDLEVLAARGVSVETLVFEGGHDWTEEVHQAAGSFLRRVLDLGAPDRPEGPPGSR